MNAGSVYVNAGNAPTWLQQQIQSALNYVENPSTFFFSIPLRVDVVSAG